jgi:hypothetical protein
MQPISANVSAGNPCLRGRISTVDLRVLTSLDHLILRLKTYLPLLQNKLP